MTPTDRRLVLATALHGARVGCIETWTNPDTWMCNPEQHDLAAQLLAVALAELNVTLVREPTVEAIREAMRNA